MNRCTTNTVTVIYTNEDDGVHLHCENCNETTPLGHAPTIPTINRAAEKHINK